MSGTMKISKFDNAISEYKNTEMHLKQNFIQGVIKLGEILKRHRDVFKPDKKWTKYLQEIEVNVSTARQFIRIFEYGEKDMKNLLACNITGWGKLQSFLSLPEELKDQVASAVDGQEVSTDEFKDVVDDIKSDDSENLEIGIDDELELGNLIGNSSLIDLHFLAKQVLKEMNKQDEFNFSNNCLPIIEAFLGTQKIKRDLEDKVVKKLTKEESNYWLKQIYVQLNNLLKLIDLYAPVENK